jgi:hypothetical protein
MLSRSRFEPKGVVAGFEGLFRFFEVFRILAGMEALLPWF